MAVLGGNWTRFWGASWRQAPRLAAVAAVWLTLVGCGGVEEAKLDDYLEELVFNTTVESLKEVPLGDYKVSAATRFQEATQSDSQRIWVQITCKLYVVVAPEDESTIVSAYEQHRGIFDDMVVQIFRSSSIDELSDPRWSTIKSRLTDIARPILGGERIRQLVIDDYGWGPI